VVNRVIIPRGDLRIAEVEVLTGDHTITMCREYGFCYRLDVARTFYTSRLASERHRVWMQVMRNEEVLVPFAGVGPFVIPPASRGARVTAVEKNPESCRFLRENIILNGVKPQVIVHQGELEKILPALPFNVDRVIIPAPYGYDQVLFSLLPLVRPGGYLHFSTFKQASQVPALVREYRQSGLRVEYARRCGHVAPGVARYVFDMVKEDGSTSS
jgi:tRNA (guanine37-N1)-methyltransferase